MRRRLVAAAAAVLLTLGVASTAVEQTSAAGRGVCNCADHGQRSQH